jgi:hypothetical protein
MGNVEGIDLKIRGSRAHFKNSATTSIDTPASQIKEQPSHRRSLTFRGAHGLIFRGASCLSFCLIFHGAACLKRISLGKREQSSSSRTSEEAENNRASPAAAAALAGQMTAAPAGHTRAA